jgi:hypothetical protein
MHYLRVVVCDEQKMPLYQRDYKVRDLLEPIVHRLVEQLVDQDMLFHGEHIGAVMVPHYGELIARRPTVLHDKERATAYRESFSLAFDGPPQPDTPLTAFSCELRVRERAVIYRSEFAVRDLRLFWQNLERSLVQMRVLNKGQQYVPRLYARDDDQHRFGVDEVMAWTRGDTPLVEIVDDLAPAPAFERRSMGDFAIEQHVQLDQFVQGASDMAARLDHAEVTVLIGRATLDEVRQIALSGARVEEGGVLVGQVYERADGPGYLVEISDHIKAERTFASITELRYTFESWQKQNAVLKERFPGKRIVGWYHTHLVRMNVLRIEGSQGTLFDTGLFFSRDDHFMHRQFFREKWYVALVLDTEATAAFFCWVGDEILPSPGYAIVRQEGAL